jgi:hypothetical protein
LRDGVSGALLEGVVSREPFVWYPRRLSRAHDQRKITYEQFSLATFLCGAADYRTATLTIRIVDLKRRMCRTRRSDDSIRRDLHALKAAELIDFDVEERQRWPWVIRLTGLRVREADESTAANSGVTAANSDASLRQSTAADGQPQEGAAAHGERDAGAAELPHAEIAPSTSSSMKEEQLLGEDTREVEFSLDGLDPDVRENVLKGRAARAKDASIDLGTARWDELEDELEDAYQEGER